MKILVVGDSNSIFIKQLIEYVLLDGKRNEIVLIEENTTNTDYEGFYSANGVHIVPRVNKNNRLVAKIPKIRASVGNYLWCKGIIKQFGTFDLVHIHGLNFSRGNIARYMRKYTKKLVITVWGDEIFRASEKNLTAYTKYYDLADCITVSTSDMQRKFTSVYGDRYGANLRMNKFGVGVLDYIDAAKETFDRRHICAEFGITDPDKLFVFVGHNGRPAQRHLELTKCLKALPEQYKERITLIYTMTYGVPGERYVQDIVTEAKRLNLDFVVLRNYLNEVQTAKLRSICDIMLHAQLTDAFSASLCESLYAGAVILNGSWLVYNDLPDCHNRFVEYDRIEEIPEKLSEVLGDFPAFQDKAMDNKAVIRSICSREVTTQEWKKTIY